METETLEIVSNNDEDNVQTIVKQLQQIEKGISTQDNRYILRVLLVLPKTRRILTFDILRAVAEAKYVEQAKLNEFLALIPTDKVAKEKTCWKKHSPVDKKLSGNNDADQQEPVVAAVDAYLYLLMLLKLIDKKQLSLAQKCCEKLMKQVVCHSGHSLDLIGSRVYYFYSLTAELNNQLAEVRPFLLHRLRCATLCNDFEAQAVLINCLLRSYLHYNLYDQADKLVQRCKFPTSANNNEQARYFYYLGRIEAVKLKYTDAQKHLLLALRRAPQNTAIGFRQAAQKLELVVDLLLGNLPNRGIFREPVLRRSLAPYFQLAQAVRLGDVKRFTEVIEEFNQKFLADKTYTLIIRLRHNVIKTALRSIASAYSCIPLSDIAERLLLDTQEDAEYVVAKAMRDGVIDGRINLKEQSFCTTNISNLYSTKEPAFAFSERTSFCFDLHNKSVKAMRYTPDMELKMKAIRKRNEES